MSKLGVGKGKHLHYCTYPSSYHYRDWRYEDQVFKHITNVEEEFSATIESTWVVKCHYKGLRNVSIIGPLDSRMRAPNYHRDLKCDVLLCCPTFKVYPHTRGSGMATQHVIVLIVLTVLRPMLQYLIIPSTRHTSFFPSITAHILAKRPSPTMAFPFLRLPPELRHLVYNHAIISPESITRMPYPPQQYQEPIAAFLRANRLIYDEAKATFYNHNTFSHYLPSALYNRVNCLQKLVINRHHIRNYKHLAIFCSQRYWRDLCESLRIIATTDCRLKTLSLNLKGPPVDSVRQELARVIHSFGVMERIEIIADFETTESLKQGEKPCMEQFVEIIYKQLGQSWEVHCGKSKYDRSWKLESVPKARDI